MYIRLGHLTAIDVSAKADKRPNWRILGSDFDDFVRARSSNVIQQVNESMCDMDGAPPGAA